MSKYFRKTFAAAAAVTYVLSTAFFSPPAGAADYETGLVGHWTLDETADSTPGREYREAVFEGESGYWGKTALVAYPNISPQLDDAEGVYGKAFRQGSRGNSYATLMTESAPTELLDKNREMTIALWVKTPSALQSGDSWVMGLGSLSTSNRVAWNLECGSANGLQWEIMSRKNSASGGYENTSEARQNLVPASELRTDTWYHVALKLKYGVARNTDGRGTLVTFETYLNGERKGSGSMDWEVVLDSFFKPNVDYRLGIGSGIRGATNPSATNFKGVIDDVRIYNTASVDIGSLAKMPEKVVYIAPNGDDISGDGSLENPFGTLGKARDFIKENNISGNVTVYLRGGIYTVTKTVTFDESHSAASGCTVTYAAYPGEVPIISGGVSVSGWTEESDGVYKAKIDADAVRHVYKNGKLLDNVESDAVMPASIFKDDLGYYRGFYVDKDVIATNMNPADLRLNIEQTSWSNCILKVEGIEDAGRYNKVYIDKNPYKCVNVTSCDEKDCAHEKLNFLHTAITNSSIIPTNPIFRVENYGWKSLDEGEWYFDSEKSELYYRPEADEDVYSANITVPLVERILNLDGNPDKDYNYSTQATDKSVVSGIKFQGITFEGASWNDGCYRTYKTFQAGELYGRRHEVEDSMVPSGIRLEQAKNITFERCTVRCFGGAGIGMYENCENITVNGCSISEVGDTGINIGSCQIRHELSKLDYDYFHTKNVTVKNNLVSRTGRTFYGSSGIEIYSATGANVSNNCVRETPYTGIGVGFYTTNDEKTIENTSVRANLIESVCERLYDGGGIYTLSRGDGTVVSQNYIKRVLNVMDKFGMSSGRASYGIYLDAGTSNITVEDNVIENTDYAVSFDVSPQKVIRRTFTDCPYSYTDRPSSDTETVDGFVLEAPTVVSDLTANAEAAAIMAAAGPERDYWDIPDVERNNENTPPIISADNAVVSARVFEPVTVNPDISDDGLPFKKIDVKWTVTKAPESAYNTYSIPSSSGYNQYSALSGDKYPEGVYIKPLDDPCRAEITFAKEGSYTIECGASDGLAKTVKSFSFNVSGILDFENVALDGTASASSNYNENAYDEKNVIDGTEKYYATQKWGSFSDDPQYIQVDLGASFELRFVTLKMRGKNVDVAANSNYIVKASNDENFGDSVTLGGISGLPVIPVGRTLALSVPGGESWRYIRVFGTLKGSIMIVDEISAYVKSGDNLVFVSDVTASAENGVTQVKLTSKKAKASGDVLIGVFDKNGMLKGVEYKKNIEVPYETSLGYVTQDSKTVELSSPLGARTGDTVKVFMWKKLDEMTPVEGFNVGVFNIK